MADVQTPQVSKGLEGIYIDESSICKVDGQAGKLYYRGYPIEAVCKNASYEEVAFLLLNGRLPNKAELDDITKTMAKERDLPDGVIQIIKEMNGKAHPMDTLRSAFSALSAYDKEVTDQSSEANMRKAIRIISKVSSIVAAIGRLQKGQPYIKPDTTLDHVTNFLYMLNGRKPTQLEYNIVKDMFILHAEHSSNASTFGTLVAASTMADMYAAVTAGIATLKGPLHGGADEAALKMMGQIGNPNNTEQYIEDALAGKQKIMGFGHRVYKTYDPRARIVRDYLLQIKDSSSPEVRTYTEIALRAEKLMIDKLGASKGIWPNIDFFAGPIYLAAGVPADLFTPIFAASRSVGWTAHVLEYWQNNRIFRPLEIYTGKVDLQYVPIDKRA
ncbi:MAG: citrate synthase/methylcitrate synthase [Candidatus Marsarchaeota archaeon]|jgi:citrate synthase|nr:citrate synthase/methylcitrate synthase [Candidatus Marsarchaeota archaeon]